MTFLTKLCLFSSVSVALANPAFAAALAPPTDITIFKSALISLNRDSIASCGTHVVICLIMPMNQVPPVHRGTLTLRAIYTLVTSNASKDLRRSFSSRLASV